MILKLSTYYSILLNISMFTTVKVAALDIPTCELDTVHVEYYTSDVA